MQRRLIAANVACLNSMPNEISFRGVVRPAPKPDQPGYAQLRGEDTGLAVTCVLRIPPARIRGNGSRRGAVLDAELGVDLLEMLIDRPRA
jgi:hypothetical protein